MGRIHPDGLKKSSFEMAQLPLVPDERILGSRVLKTTAEEAILTKAV